jgi:hypothetical protein
MRAAWKRSVDFAGAQTGLGMRDVLVLPSMVDVVRGVDAHDGSGIWQVTFGTPVTSSGQIDWKNINQHGASGCRRIVERFMGFAAIGRAVCSTSSIRP